MKDGWESGGAVFATDVNEMATKYSFRQKRLQVWHWLVSTRGLSDPLAIERRDRERKAKKI